MSIVYKRWQGRTGNKIMQYLHARAYAEQHGAELCTPPWIGQKIFDLHERDFGAGLPLVQDWELNNQLDIEVDGYALHQACAIYTKAQAQAWLPFRPEVAEKLRSMPPFPDHIFHKRRGDYCYLDYVVVSDESYVIAARKLGYNPDDFTSIEEEGSEQRPQPFETELSFLPDFWRLMQAKVLFRSNSTFGWAAALLGNAEHLYSPDQTGMPHLNKRTDPVGPLNVPFVEGNWPAIASGFDHCTDLHLKGEL
jgi:hypothetical protein